MSKSLTDLVSVLYFENGQTLNDVLPTTAVPVEASKQRDSLATGNWALALQVEDAHFEDTDSKYFSSRRRFLVSDIHPGSKAGVKIQLVCGGDFALAVNTNKVTVGDQLVVVRPKVRSFGIEGMIDEAYIGFGYSSEWKIVIYRDNKVAPILPIACAISHRPIYDSGIKYTEISKCTEISPKYNTWGIIRKIDCYPRKTHGSDYLSRIYIQDEFSIKTGIYSDFQLNIFDSQILNFPPMSVGDVIKVRHMKVKMFNNHHTGTIFAAKACTVFKGDFFGKIEQTEVQRDIPDFDFLMIIKLRGWWRHLTSDLAFLTSNERTLGHINSASLTMLACRLVKVIEIEDDGAEFKQVIRICDGTSPALPFFLQLDESDRNELVPYDKCVDIFIGRTKEIPIDLASSIGKIALILVKCVKVNSDNFSSVFKLIYAGHTFVHFRLLPENHDLAIKIKERLGIAPEFPNSQEFNEIVQSFNSPVLLSIKDAQTNLCPENHDNQNPSTSGKREFSLKQSGTPVALKQDSLSDTEEDCKHLGLYVTKSDEESSGMDLAPIVQTYESNNEHLVIEKALPNGSFSSSTQDSFHSVLESQVWATCPSSYPTQERVPLHKSPETQRCTSRSSPTKHYTPSKKSTLSSSKTSEGYCPNKDKEPESALQTPLSVPNQILNCCRDSEGLSIINSVETLHTLKARDQVIFECSIVDTNRSDRVWNLIWFKCAKCNISRKARRPPKRLRNNTCRGCKGKMEQTLSMSTRVEDAFGSFTTLEWSEEACEALFECKTQELAENKDIQKRVSLKIESLNWRRVRVTVSVAGKRKYIVVVQ